MSVFYDLDQLSQRDLELRLVGTVAWAPFERHRIVAALERGAMINAEAQHLLRLVLDAAIAGTLRWDEHNRLVIPGACALDRAQIETLARQATGTWRAEVDELNRKYRRRLRVLAAEREYRAALWDAA